MKIAFWASAYEKCGVTSNLACISIVTSMEYSYKSVLIENHYQQNKLENILKYNRANFQSKGEIDCRCCDSGMDYILNYISIVNNDRNEVRNPSHNLIKEAATEVLCNSLYFVPVSYLTNKETFDYNLYRNIYNLLDALEAFADIVYIDTSGKNNLSSKIILDEADLVVVNLTQNFNMIQYFFDNYSSIISKCVFLISNYNKNSNLNINYLSNNLLINKSNIAVIPYNVEYEEAVSEGTVIEFISRNYNCKRKNPNYNFIREAKRAADIIMHNAMCVCNKEQYL